MITQTEFGASIARTVGGQVKHHREARGWSARQLADECARLGMPSVTRNLVSDLETGRRQLLGVAEVLVIARALDVPPLLLLFPVGVAEEAEALPGEIRSPFRAAAWFSGETPFPGKDDEDYVIGIAADWNAATGNPLAIYRAYDRAAVEETTALRRARSFEERAASADGDDREAFAAAAAALRQAAEGHRAAAESVRQQARTLGILPPGPRVDEG